MKAVRLLTVPVSLVLLALIFASIPLSQNAAHTVNQVMNQPIYHAVVITTFDSAGGIQNQPVGEGSSSLSVTWMPAIGNGGCRVTGWRVAFHMSSGLGTKISEDPCSPEVVANLLEELKQEIVEKWKVYEEEFLQKSDPTTALANLIKNIRTMQ